MRTSLLLAFALEVTHPRNMVFEYRSSSERHKLTDQVGSYVFFGMSLADRSYLPGATESTDICLQDDIFNTKDASAQDPLAGIWFRIEQGPPIGPGVYSYDEAGVVWEGTIFLHQTIESNADLLGTVTMSDESGIERTLGPGDSFFIHRGSTVKFSSTDYGICFKCAARPKGKL